MFVLLPSWRTTFCSVYSLCTSLDQKTDNMVVKMSRAEWQVWRAADEKISFCPIVVGLSLEVVRDDIAPRPQTTIPISRRAGYSPNFSNSISNYNFWSNKTIFTLLFYNGTKMIDVFTERLLKDHDMSKILNHSRWYCTRRRYWSN